MDFLQWVEQTGLATWVRESSSLWAYPAVLFLHTMGLAIVVGLNAAIDFRIIGLAPDVPLSPLARLFPLMWFGFTINALSGTALLMADASMKLTNPVFYIKLIFIGLALVNLRLIKNKVFADPLVDKRPLATNTKILAVTSLIFWIGATTAGRLMAYIGSTR